MIIKLLASICLLISIMSCNSDNTRNKDTDNTNSNPASPLNCYQFANASDTIALKTIHVGEAITGTLVYQLYQKNKNLGTIQGSMKGDLLIADYTFTSEGITSVRQVVFKKEGNSFIEGHGDVETKGERVVFKNIGALTFNNMIKLVEKSCQQ